MLSAYRHWTLCTLLTLAIAASLVVTPALAAPELGSKPPAATQSLDVTLTRPSPSVSPTGTFALTVAATAAAPAEYLEVRVRLRSPSGRLVYQKTEVRSQVPAGTHAIDFERDLADLDLSHGSYPLEVRVLASGAEGVTKSSRFLIVDPKTPVLQVAVVVALEDVPSVTMAGRFWRDPADSTGLRDDLAALTQLALTRREPLTLAVPPLLIEQLGRAASGYETTAGVVAAHGDEVPARYTHLLDSLRSAITTGTIELVDVPYALPDLAGLRAMNAASDIALHWKQTDAINTAILHTTPKTESAYFGSTLTPEVIASAAERGNSYVLSPATAIRTGDAEPEPGLYRVGTDNAAVIAVDHDAEAALASSQDEFYASLFEHLDGGPAVIVLHVGPDAPSTVVDVQHALDWIDEAWWLRANDVASAAEQVEPKRATASPLVPTAAPSTYWIDLIGARATALAYAGAVGPADADGAAVLRSVLAAESSLWAGSDGEWAKAPQAAARSAEAAEFARAQFATVRVDVKDVTLSGSKGEVPLTVVNDSGKPLALSLHASSESGLSTAASLEFVAQPAQTFLTLPVDLGNGLSDTIAVTIRAGDVAVTEADVDVKASYIDRLAVVLMVVVVLTVLLAIIRRRVGNPVADTIGDDRRRMDPPSHSK